MKESSQRQKELKITQDEWLAVWMLGRVQKRKRIDGHEFQSLRDVVKKGGDNVLKNFEEKFKEVRVEGKRVKSSSIHYTEVAPDSSSIHYTEVAPEDLSKYTREELETLYMGTSSEARRRFQRNGSFQRRQSFDRRRSSSRDTRFPPRQSRFDGYKSGDGKQHDRS